LLAPHAKSLIFKAGVLIQVKSNRMNGDILLRHERIVTANCRNPFVSTARAFIARE
jgi:hypothetical protein